MIATKYKNKYTFLFVSLWLDKINFKYFWLAFERTGTPQKDYYHAKVILNIYFRLLGDTKFRMINFQHLYGRNVPNQGQ